MTFAAFMCNSDKYSLYFSMMQLPKEARKMMMNQFDSQATEMIQQNKEELISKRGKQDTIIGQYIQDLYRFFKLYPGHIFLIKKALQTSLNIISVKTILAMH